MFGIKNERFWRKCTFKYTRVTITTKIKAFIIQKTTLSELHYLNFNLIMKHVPSIKTQLPKYEERRGT